MWTSQNDQQGSKNNKNLPGNPVGEPARQGLHPNDRASMPAVACVGDKDIQMKDETRGVRRGEQRRNAPNKP